MAATEPSRALRALSGAALALPGLRLEAALPVAQPEANVQTGFYQESDDRMRVEVYHGDFVLPFRDRFEFTFSLDRDTYSGATPAFSAPAAMLDQPKFSQNDDGSPAAALSLADVVSAASQRVTAGGLTILGGLNAFQSFVDARAAAEAAFIAANPRPASPPPPPTLPGPVTLDFAGMTFATISGGANLTPQADGSCPGLGALGCHVEDGMAVGIVADSSNPVAHLHRAGPAANRRLAYHGDSSGIYVRALDGSTFNLERMDFVAPISPINPDAGADDVWEILGFSTATDPTLDLGDGTNYPNRVALQTVANGFSGTLDLDAAFQGISAFWIHYKGYPQTPTDGKEFDMSVDNIQLGAVQAQTGETAEQVAWAQQLEREVAIAQFQAVLDTAVPAGTAPVQRFAQQPRESRTQPVFGTRVFFDETTLALSAGFSDEPDFRSDFGSFTLSRELNDRHTTLAFGYGYTHNAITRSEVGHGAHGGAAHGGDTHGGGHDANEVDYAALDEESDFHNLHLSLGQVLDRNRLLQVSLGYTHQRGYLSNPYKFVYVRGEITAEEYYELWQAGEGEVDWRAVTPLEVVGIELFRERRPDLRRQWSTSLRLNQHLPAWNATLHADYRFYTDDWDVSSHTFEVEWFQQLPRDLTLVPFVRYYSQSEADFFAPFFLAPRADHTYSSDFRLSGYGALSGGVTLEKRLGPALRLSLGAEYYTHQGDLKLGGGGSGDYADLDHYLLHAALNVDLAAATRGGGAGDSAGHAHARHATVPAGVMFAHTLDSAGAMMLGYRYMDMRNAGDLQQGTDRVSLAAVRSGACGPSECRTRPGEMTMRMHMLELMVAPTPWLTLMLMPQIVDSDMNLVPLPGALEATEHVGEHTSDGLGDTTVAALFNVHEDPVHRVVGSLGFSAPTGDSEATMDGAPDSLHHDYGMQRGSGTWDAKPSLTVLGARGEWQWGAQVNGTLRLEDRNGAGYAVGDTWQFTGWGGRRLGAGFTATLRALYAVHGGIDGRYRARAATESTVDQPQNYGGTMLDLGIGLEFRPPGAAFAGHAFSAEWLQPMATDFSGVQLERNGALMANWSYAF